jgi:hypothetical protein
MRFGYADPPFPGTARKYYRDHPDYAGEVDHEALIARLEGEFDAWALSTSQRKLGDVLALCPPEVPRGAVGGGSRPQYRILSWHKYVGHPGSGKGVAPAARYCWEPVILRGGRNLPAGSPRPLDWLIANPEMYTFREKPAEYVTGEKPAAFCRWLFACAGLEPDDEFVDLFAGSGTVAHEWDAYRRQTSLLG